MALTEISFPKSWLSVPKESSKLVVVDEFTLSLFRIMPNSPFLPSAYTDVYLTAGYYTSVSDLVEEINRSMMHTMPHNEFRPFIMYDEMNRKVSVKLQYLNTLKLSKHLANILGFHDSTIANYNNVHKIIEANTTSHIDERIHSLYIYTDVIENTHVGDTESPLLRNVEIEGRFGEVIHHSYAMPNYVPLRKKSFDSIEIDIKDVFGNPVSFENGTVVVTLHFRSASYL